MSTSLVVRAFIIVLVGVVGSAHGSLLLPRDFDGDMVVDAYYDAAQDITWLKDANYAMTSGYDTDGRMTWSRANEWAAWLNFGGYRDWRLPTLTPVAGGERLNINFSTNGTTDYGTAGPMGWVDSGGRPTNEMGYLFYVVLGGTGICLPSMATGCESPPSYGLAHTSPFLNLHSHYYWTDRQQNTDEAWYFLFDQGGQTFNSKGLENYAWAVRDGDVLSVSSPATVWLLGSCLAGLLLRMRRRT